MKAKLFNEMLYAPFLGSKGHAGTWNIDLVDYQRN